MGLESRHGRRAASIPQAEATAGLEFLWLDQTQVTGPGLKDLQGLNRLRNLRLGSTLITDAGLVYVKGLRNL